MDSLNVSFLLVLHLRSNIIEYSCVGCFERNKCSSSRYEFQHALPFGCVWGWVPGRFQQKEQSHSIQRKQNHEVGHAGWYRLSEEVLNGFGVPLPTVTCSLGCKCSKRRFTECLGM